MTECDEIERTHALADGELSAVEADQARAHLATCAACQAELADLVQLDMAVADREIRAEADGSKTDGVVVSLAWYRRRSVQLGGMVLAAAAIALVYVGTRPKGEPGPTTEAPVQIALGPKRLTEARMSWGDAAKHRPYDVPRAGEPPKETIGLATLAEIEKRGDLHGVGVLAMLEGDRTRAASYLERAPESADVLADRAALALGEGAPEKALALADAALDKQAGHSAATWNRALALRDLGLVRAAAAGFAAIAAKHEPGWSDEATARGVALDADTDARRDRAAAVFGAQSSLGAGLTVDAVRALPGLARLVLYDAARAAPADKVATLAPLFEALGPEAKATLARIQKHPELAAGYAELIATVTAGTLQSATASDYIAKARAAQADEHYIGAAVLAGYGTVDKSEIFQIAAHAAASPDPWFQLIGLEQQAAVALAGDDLAGAETVLLRARERCAAGTAPSYRCTKVDSLLADTYTKWQRLPEARAILADALARARRDGEWFLETNLLAKFINVAVLTDDVAGTGLPLVRAYGEEDRLRYADKCEDAVWSRAMTAMVLINQLRFADASREVAAMPKCDKQMDAGAIAQIVFVRAHLARESKQPDQLAALRADIAKLRAAPDTTPTLQMILDHSEGRAVIDREPAAGEELLRRAIAAAKKAPREDATAHKVIAWSHNVLAIAQAHRGDADAALATLAEAQGVAVPATCVLGLALDDQRRIAAGRGADGKPFHHYDEQRTTTALDPAKLVPTDIAQKLAGCASVDVIARSPIHGSPRLLGDALAWRYLSPRPSAQQRTAGGRDIVIADVAPPASLGLPRLARWTTRGELVSGPTATPSRVLEAVGTADVATIHAHGIVDLGRPDASYLALSPDEHGRYALTAGTVAAARFRASPLVILAACRASQSAPVLHEAWSLPVAFIQAGARAVIASAAPIPDGDADAFFDSVRKRIAAAAPAAIALRDARVDWLSQRRGDWVRDVIVFE